MKCHIVKDLLPNYVDGLNSDETNNDIKEHLAGCDDCRAIYDNMTAEVEPVVQPEDNGIDFLRKLKRAILRKNVIAAITSCVLIIACMGGLFAVLFRYETEVQYDAERTKVEIARTGILEMINEDGWTGERWRVLGEDEPEEGEIARDELTIATYNIPYYQKYVQGRNITRDGKQIRVVYYCYTQTPFIRLLYRNSLFDYNSTGNYFGYDLQGNDFEPKMIEVYYLPDLYKLERSIEGFTDEKYDAERERGTLVWSGVI